MFFRCGVAQLLTARKVVIVLRFLMGGSITCLNLRATGPHFATEQRGSTIERGNYSRNVFVGPSTIFGSAYRGGRGFVAIGRVTIFVGYGAAIDIAIGDGTWVGILFFCRATWVFGLDETTIFVCVGAI